MLTVRLQIKLTFTTWTGSFGHCSVAWHHQPVHSRFLFHTKESFREEELHFQLMVEKGELETFYFRKQVAKHSRFWKRECQYLSVDMRKKMISCCCLFFVLPSSPSLSLHLSLCLSLSHTHTHTHHSSIPIPVFISCSVMSDSLRPHGL